jgi:hypothetical protein
VLSNRFPGATEGVIASVPRPRAMDNLRWTRS